MFMLFHDSLGYFRFVQRSSSIITLYFADVSIMEQAQRYAFIISAPSVCINATRTQMRVPCGFINKKMRRTIIHELVSFYFKKKENELMKIENMNAAVFYVHFSKNSAFDDNQSDIAASHHLLRTNELKH